MPVRRYTCKSCGWPFVLDLESNENTFGRYTDRRSILCNHLIDEHEYKGKFSDFSRAISTFFDVQDL